MMTCAIIEDEIRAKEVLERYIDKVDYLNLVGYCQNGLEALDKIPKWNPDIIFLDINMPNLNGLELLQILGHRPKVIITTAYSDYALESYEFEVVDYLLKPVEFNKFMRAVNRAKDTTSNLHSGQRVSSEKTNDGPYSLFKSGSKTHKVYYNDILYLEKDGNYLEIHLVDGQKILIRSNMSDVMNLVPESLFQRVHKSFVVNINAVEIIEVNKLTLTNRHKIPLGASFRQALNNRIENRQQ
ncbi:LytTR family DNA-binding domain-containing protein [Muricauda sp. ANG21]|uniref:LytR/AlgR family response regulator transcription factor n=1 Tax=Allomuricauda sp. ANG21 TaxID=3042468 RepID=UPI0034520AE4